MSPEVIARLKAKLDAANAEDSAAGQTPPRKLAGPPAEPKAKRRGPSPPRRLIGD